MKFERFGLGIAKGMALTLKHLFRPPLTVQYPNEKLVVSKRIRGNELVWFQDRCTGCGTCTKACLQGNIILVTHRGGENKFIVDKFELDSGRCIFCGLCVESCPYDALAMGLEYECAKYLRSDTILSKEKLNLSDKHQPSAYYRPQFAAKLPEQSLLIFNRKEGGQKLTLFPFSKRKRGPGA